MGMNTTRTLAARTAIATLCAAALGAGGGAPAGCTGRWEVRNGTMTGRFHLVADSTYFHTIDLAQLKVFVSRTAVGACDQSAAGPTTSEPCTHGDGIAVSQPGSGLTI